jgi:hypothetical protein
LHPGLFKLSRSAAKKKSKNAYILFNINYIQKNHKAQLLTCLHFAKKKVGLLINFNVNLLKNGIRRYKI